MYHELPSLALSRTPTIIINLQWMLSLRASTCLLLSIADLSTSPVRDTISFSSLLFSPTKTVLHPPFIIMPESRVTLTFPLLSITLQRLSSHDGAIHHLLMLYTSLTCV